MPVTAKPPGLSCRQRPIRPRGHRVIGLIAHEGRCRERHCDQLLSPRDQPGKKAAGAAVICGRDAVPRPEGAGKVRGAAESPAGGDVGDGHLAQALIG